MDGIAEKEKSVFKKYINLLSKNISFEGKKVLDVGCGTGNFIKTLSFVEKNIKIYGLDYNDKAVKILKKEKYNVEKYNLDDNLNIFFDEKFDIITMFDVIEHLNSFISFEKILNKNLVKGGYLVLTTPNSNSIERLFNSSQYSGEFDPTHRILFTPYTMDFFLRRRGFVKIFNYTPYVFSFNRNIFNQNIMYGGQIFVLYKKK